MALPAKIKSLDEIGEKYRDQYKPLGDSGADGFVLDVMRVDNYALEDVHGLKSGLQKSRAAETLAKKDLQRYREIAEEQGTDLDGLPSLMNNAFAAQKNPGANEEAVSARLAAQAETHAAQLAKVQGENAALKQSYADSQVESEINAAIAKHGGNAALLGPLLKQRVKPIENENGKTVARPVDINGNPMLTNVSGEVGDMSIDEYVTGLKSDKAYSGAFAGNGVSGTGANAGGARSGSSGTSLDDIPATDGASKMLAASKMMQDKQ